MCLCVLTDDNREFLETRMSSSAFLEQERKKLKKEWEEYQWGRNRKKTFPELGEQLDMLFHDMTAGKGTKDGEWYKAIAKVKADNPKE